MQPRLTLSALSTWYMATYLVSGTYQYVKPFSFVGRKAQQDDHHERGSDRRRKDPPRLSAPQEDKPARNQEMTHEPDAQQAIETSRTEGRTARQDRAPRANIGHKGSKPARHRRTAVTSKPARQAVSQNRAHLAEMGHKGGEEIRAHGLDTAEVKAHGLDIAEVRAHSLDTAEVGRKEHESPRSEHTGQSRTKNRNGKQGKEKSGS